MRRVLWLIKGLGPGGAERLLVGHAAVGRSAPGDQQPFAYEAAYLVPWKHHLVPELAELGVVSHCLEGPHEWDLRWAQRLRRLLLERRYDIIHAHSPYPAAVARLAVRTLPRWARPALVYTEHNLWPRYSPLTRLANRLTFRLDASRLAVSEGVRASLPARLRPLVDVVVAGVDVDAVRRHRGDRDEVRAELGVTADDVLVGTVANLRTGKAYPDLLAAARQALDASASLRFVAVGQGPLEAELLEEHHRLGLGDRFRFLGYRPDAVRILAGCDLFALSSRYEGLPVSLMEALALGLPIVATSVGGIPEAVRHGTEGILVPPGRPGLLAAAIVELAGDPGRRREMGLAAAARGEAFGVGPAVQAIEDAYRSVLDCRRPAGCRA